MTRNFDAVIFDLDGVITDTASFHFFAWKRLADQLGIYFDANINESLKGVDRMASLEIILKNSGRSFSPAEKKRLSQQKNEYYRHLIEQMTPKNIFPGVISTLDNLKRQEIKTALASASKNANTVIDKLGLRQYFDFIVDARKIKRGKPNPEIYETAARNLNSICGRCIGVEDAKAGIAAIKSAGMFAVGIGEKDTLKEADDVISGLDKFDISKYQSISIKSNI